MSDAYDRLVLMHGDETDEWPDEVKQGFHYLMMKAEDSSLAMIGAIACNKETRVISVMFTPRASSNPHLYQMCEDLRDMFAKMAKRLKQ